MVKHLHQNINPLVILVYDLIVLSLLAIMITMIIIGKPERHWIGVLLLIVLLVTGTTSFDDVLKYIEWDVLGLILCMNIYTALLERSGGATYIAEYMVRRFKNTQLLAFSLILLSGIISIALDNVTVVLVIAPIAFKLVEKTGLEPVSLVIGITLAANMSGSATMIGDPPAMITASHYNLSFMDFIIYNGKLSMFFITLIPMIISTYVYTIISLKKKEYISRDPGLEHENKELLGDKIFAYEALLFLMIQIFLLSIKHLIHISLTLAALTNISGLILTRLIIHRDYESVRESLVKGFEWKTLIFLSGVFVLSGAFEKHGLAYRLAVSLLSMSNNLYGVTTLLIWISVAISAVLDNIPYVTTMLPVIDVIASKLSVDPVILAWALLLGATLGGGITYIGATANVVGVRLLEKRGYKISFYEFVKRSLPFNLVNVLTGWIIYVLVWLV